MLTIKLNLRKIKGNDHTSNRTSNESRYDTDLKPTYFYHNFFNNPIMCVIMINREKIVIPYKSDDSPITIAHIINYDKFNCLFGN